VSAAVVDLLPNVGQVLYIRGRARPARFRAEPRSLADLGAIGATLHQSDGVTQLWLTPRWSAGRPLEGITRAWTPQTWLGEPAAVVMPALDRRLEALLAEVDGKSLFDTLESLRVSFTIGNESTPGRTAEALLRHALSRRGEYQPLRLPSPLPWVTEPVLNWIRPLEAGEREIGTWVLAVDRIGAYLHSMLLADVGLGEPTVRLASGADWRNLIWTPGYFHARLAPETAQYLPDPLHSGPVGGWAWLTTPTLRLGVVLDRILDVDQMVTWPRRSRALAPVARRIHAARAALPDSLRPIGEPLLKRTYTELVGRLRADFHRGTPLYRPDWYSIIVADARCRIWRAAADMAGLAPWTPAAINIDCWYVAWPRMELPPGFDPRFWKIKAATAAGPLHEAFARRELHTVTRALRRAVLP
jgi:hypothetical protein